MKGKIVVVAAVSAVIVSGVWGEKRLKRFARRLHEEAEYRRAFTGQAFEVLDSLYDVVDLLRQSDVDNTFWRQAVETKLRGLQNLIGQQLQLVPPPTLKVKHDQAVKAAKMLSEWASDISCAISTGDLKALEEWRGALLEPIRQLRVIGIQII